MNNLINFKGKVHLVIFVLLTISISCSNGDDAKPNNTSRTLQFEITGNFSGNIIASYTGANGNTINEQVLSLPWTKEVIYNTTVAAAVIGVSGNGGGVNQQVSLIIKKGGVQIANPYVFTADSQGGFIGSTPGVLL